MYQVLYFTVFNCTQGLVSIQPKSQPTQPGFYDRCHNMALQHGTSSPLCIVSCFEPGLFQNCQLLAATVLCCVSWPLQPLQLLKQQGRPCLSVQIINSASHDPVWFNSL